MREHAVMLCFHITLCSIALLHMIEITILQADIIVWGSGAIHWYSRYLSHVMRKPVFMVCDQLRLKVACSADETS